MKFFPGKYRTYNKVYNVFWNVSKLGASVVAPVSNLLFCVAIFTAVIINAHALQVIILNVFYEPVLDIILHI